MSISEHFGLQEFIDPVTWNELGEASIEKIDRRLIDIAELLRAKCGKPVVINNWATGGQYKESGLRREDSPTGAKRSAHKPLPEQGGICKAIDCKVMGVTPAMVQHIVLTNESEFYDAGVRQMEDLSFTPSWTHLSTRGTDNAEKKIQIIKP